MSQTIIPRTRWLETATYAALGSTVALCVTLSIHSLPNGATTCGISARMPEKSNPDGRSGSRPSTTACIILAGASNTAVETGHSSESPKGLRRADSALMQPARLNLAPMLPPSATVGNLGNVVIVFDPAPALGSEWLVNGSFEGVSGEAGGPLSFHHLGEGQGLARIAAVVSSLLLLALIRRSFTAQKAQASQVADAMAKLERSATENTAQLHRDLAALRLHAAHLDATLESVRMRVAQELHDELGSILTALKFELSGGSGSAPQAGLRLYARRASADLVDTAMQSVRNLIATVQPYPLQRAGLWGALVWQAGEFEKTWGIPCRVHIPEDLPWPSKEISLTAFRIVEEGLANSRHAYATRVDILVEFVAGQLRIDVSDNGQGLTNDGARPGADVAGLTGMRERARTVNGTVTLFAPAGQGTMMRFMVQDQCSKEPTLLHDEVF